MLNFWSFVLDASTMCLFRKKKLGVHCRPCYICCKKSAGPTLHLVVQTGRFDGMHIKYSTYCTGSENTTFRVWWVAGCLLNMQLFGGLQGVY